MLASEYQEYLEHVEKFSPAVERWTRSAHLHAALKKTDQGWDTVTLPFEDTSKSAVSVVSDMLKKSEGSFEGSHAASVCSGRYFHDNIYWVERGWKFKQVSKKDLKKIDNIQRTIKDNLHKTNEARDPQRRLAWQTDLFSSGYKKRNGCPCYSCDRI